MNQSLLLTGSAGRTVFEVQLTGHMARYLVLRQPGIAMIERHSLTHELSVFNRPREGEGEGQEHIGHDLAGFAGPEKSRLPGLAPRAEVEMVLPVAARRHGQAVLQCTMASRQGRFAHEVHQSH